MLKRITARWSLLLAVVVTFLLPVPRARAEESDAEWQARRAVRRLAMIHAVRAYLRSPGFLQVPQSQLVAAIRADILVHRDAHRRTAKRTVRMLFARAFDRQIEQLAEAIDPGGGFGIHEWAKQEKICTPDGKKTLREIAEERVAGDLAGPQSVLLARYDNARVVVVRSQVDAARKRLARTPGIVPSSGEVVAAARSPGSRRKLTDRIFALLTGKDAAHLLVEARDRIREMAVGLVENGVVQHHAQEKALRQGKLTAWGRNGILRELKAVGEADVRRRRKSEAFKNRKVYDLLFRPDDPVLKELARGRCEQKLTSVIRATSPQPSAVLLKEIREDIVRSPGRHRTHADTLGAYDRRARDEAKQRVIRRCCQKAKEAASRFDRPAELKALSTEVAAIWAAPWPTRRAAWRQLATRVETALKNEVARMRAEIAADQASRLCPDLMNGRWRPDEAVLQRNPLEGFGWRGLKQLSVWRVRPPAGKLIAETEGLLLATAKERLQLGRDAITGQHRCVVELKAGMVRRIRREAYRGPDFWFRQYIAAVLQQWVARGEPRAAVEAYRKLFAATREQVRGIVHEAIRAEIDDTRRRILKSRRSRLARRLEKLLAEKSCAEASSLGRTLREYVLDEWKTNPLFEQDPRLGMKVEDEIQRTAAGLADSHNRAVTRRIEQDRLERERRHREALEKERRREEMLERERRRKEAIEQERRRQARERERQQRQAQAAQESQKEYPTPAVTSRPLSSAPIGPETDVPLHREEPSSEAHDVLLPDEGPGAADAPSSARLQPDPGEAAGSGLVSDNAAGLGDHQGTTDEGEPGAAVDDGSTGGAPRGARATGESEEGDSPGAAGPGGGTDRGLSGEGKEDEEGEESREVEKHDRRPDSLPSTRVPVAWRWGFPALLLLLMAVVALLLYLWHRKRREVPSPFPKRRFRSHEEELAAIIQLRLAFEHVETFEPDGPVASLEDVGKYGRQLFDQIQSAWKQRHESRILPELQFETAYVVYGAVLILGCSDRLPLSSHVGGSSSRAESESSGHGGGQVSTRQGPEAGEGRRR